MGRFRQGFFLVGRRPKARSAGAPSGRVEERLRGAVRLRWLRFFDGFPDESIIAMGKGVASLIAVERGREAANENALSDAPLMPACFS